MDGEELPPEETIFEGVKNPQPRSVPTMVWPIRGVSADSNNLATLGADGQIQIDSNVLDSRYVNVTGDTMTGDLTTSGTFTSTRDAGATVTLNTHSNTNLSAVVLRRTRGSSGSQLPMVNGDALGRINFPFAGTDAVERNGPYIAGSVLSGQGLRGYDSRILIACPAADPAKAVSFVRLSNYASSNSLFEVSAANFAVSSAGIISASALVSTGVISGLNGRFTQTPVAAEQAGVALIGRVTGASPATASISGLQAFLDGQAAVSTGVSVVNSCVDGNAFGVAVTTGSGTINTGILIQGGEVKNGSFALASQDLNESYFRGNLAVGRTGTSTTLDVGGDATIRGECNVVGNIVSTGTAHSFQPNSIPSPAVIGRVPVTIAATGSAGSAGQMIWDENFLYLHTLSGWKKIPLFAI